MSEQLSTQALNGAMECIRQDHYFGAFVQFYDSYTKMGAVETEITHLEANPLGLVSRVVLAGEGDKNLFRIMIDKGRLEAHQENAVAADLLRSLTVMWKLKDGTSWTDAMVTGILNQNKFANRSLGLHNQFATYRRADLMTAWTQQMQHVHDQLLYGGLGNPDFVTMTIAQPLNVPAIDLVASRVARNIRQELGLQTFIPDCSHEDVLKEADEEPWNASDVGALKDVRHFIHLRNRASAVSAFANMDELVAAETDSERRKVAARGVIARHVYETK